MTDEPEVEALVEPAPAPEPVVDAAPQLSPLQAAEEEMRKASDHLFHETRQGTPEYDAARAALATAKGKVREARANRSF